MKNPLLTSALTATSPEDRHPAHATLPGCSEHWKLRVQKQASRRSCKKQIQLCLCPRVPRPGLPPDIRSSNLSSQGLQHLGKSLNSVPQFAGIERDW